MEVFQHVVEQQALAILAGQIDEQKYLKNVPLKLKIIDPELNFKIIDVYVHPNGKFSKSIPIDDSFLIGPYQLQAKYFVDKSIVGIFKN